MSEDLPPLTPGDAGDPRERSLVDDLRGLVDEGKAAAQAEIAWQKSRLAVAGQGAKGIAGLGALALALVFFALMALVFGLVLGLASLVGPWLATVIATLGLLALAGLCALLAAGRWKRLQARLSDEEIGHG